MISLAVVAEEAEVMVITVALLPENPTTGGSPETPAINGVNISAIELIDVNNAATQVVTASGANAKVKSYKCFRKRYQRRISDFFQAAGSFWYFNGAV